MSVNDFMSRAKLITAFCNAQDRLMDSRAAAASIHTENDKKLIAENTMRINEITEVLRSTVKVPTSNTGVDYEYVEINSLESPDHAFTLEPALSPHIKATYIINDFEFEAAAMLDSGASISTFPRNRLPKQVLGYIKATTTTLQGIGGPAKLWGELNASILLGSKGVPPVHNITILVTDGQGPILIGQNVLRNGTIRYWHEDTLTSAIRFQRIGVTPKSHSCPVLSRAEVSAYTNAASTSDTLADKIKWLESEKSVSFPAGFKRHELEELADILIKYEKVLGTEDGDPGTFVRTVKLPTNGKSKSVGQFPIQEALREQFDAEIAKMEADGIIEPCEDPKGFNSAAFPVLKKSGAIRVVVNFKPTLNRCLVDLDPWPLPTIDELMANIGSGNRYFATVDLKSGYHQIPIAPEDRHKTAFMHNGRCLQWTRLAMGITSAGNIFCRSIGEALESIPNRRNIITYSDDNLVFAKTFKDFSRALENFLKSLMNFGLKVNPKKSLFMACETEFLG